MRAKGWAMISKNFGFYCGWWLTRREAIEEHCELKLESWEECRKNGDRVVKITITEGWAEKEKV